MKKFLLLSLVVLLAACSKDKDGEQNTGLKSMENGLVSYYPMDGNANDKGPNALNGIAEGTKATTDRKGNASGATLFNGVSDVITVNSYFKTKDIQTIAFWVKFNELKEGMNSMEIISKSSERQGMEVLLHQDKLKFFIMGSESSNNIGISINELNTKDWFFVTAVHDEQASRMMIYLNGVLKYSSWAPANISEVDNLMFGNWSYEKAPRFFNGSLDDIKIFNRPLNETEVEELFRQG